MRYVTTVEGKTFVIEVDREEKVIVDGQVHAVDLRRVEPLPLYSLLIDNISHEVFIEEREGSYGVVLQGKVYIVQVQEEHTWQRAVPGPTPPTAEGESLVKAPMPGLVVEVLVTTGQAVRAGEVLLVLESMKMENNLCSPQDGVVQAVHVAAQDYVAGEQILITVST